MALESNPNQAFLANDDATDDDFAALDSMAFTGGMNPISGGSGNFGSSGSGNGNGGGDRISDGREGGFTGVSESLFDRIRARTAEQQKQSLGSQSSQISHPSQESAQSSQQQQQQSSAFMSQQQPAFGMPPHQQQQASSESTMEFEKHVAAPNNKHFDASVAGASSGSITKGNDENTNEATYSFSANAGEDFSASPLHVPQYGASRDDPYYTAVNNQQQQYPTSIQDKAFMALAQTGETVKSLFGAGMNGAKSIGTMAQNKMTGVGNGGGGGGERSYNNNFLLREDSLETGNGGSGVMDAATMSAPPPPMSAAVAEGSSGPAASDQAYSMLKYGKTFCQDVFAFVMDLPPWGKGVVGVILLWALYVFFDTI